MSVSRATRYYAWLVVAALVLTGCAAGSAPARSSGSPASTASPGPASPSGGQPSIPADGIPLDLLGFANGPGRFFSVPRTAVITDRVDQPNSVTLVLSSPTALDLASYYRRTLPANGFVILRDDVAAETLTFAGHGWAGAFTGVDRSSAVFLRPA